MRSPPLISALGLLAAGCRFQGLGNFSLFGAILGAPQGILGITEVGSLFSELAALYPCTFLPLSLLESDLHLLEM